MQSRQIEHGLGHRLSTRIFFFFLKRIIGPGVRLIWIKRIKGLDNIPQEGPAIIAFNHASYFDFICFFAITPRRIHYLAAEKFYRSSFWRPIMEYTQQIKTDRKSPDKRVVHNRVIAHLKEGNIVGIFPEGTRSPDGELLPAFSGVAKYAVHTHVPIIPVGVRGTYRVMSRFHKVPRPKKIIELHIGEPIMLHKQIPDGVKPNEPMFRIFTDRIMRSIARLSGSVYRHNTAALYKHARGLAVFDLDGTLVRGHSQKHFLEYAHEKQLISTWRYGAILLRYILYRVKIVSHPESVMKYAFRFIEGKTESEIQEIIDEFFEVYIKPNLIWGTIGFLRTHHQFGRETAIASNAPDIIVNRVAKYLKVDHVRGTYLERNNGVFTGSLKDGVMYGERKARAIHKLVAQSNVSLKNLWVYTDHISDLVLLNLGRHPVVINPDRRLKKQAMRHKWPVYIF